MYFANSCIFAEFPLDPCDHLRGKIEVIKELSQCESSRYMIFNNGEALIKNADAISPVYFSHKDIINHVSSGSIFLGKDKSNNYFAVEINKRDEFAKHGDFIDLRVIARKATSHDGFSTIPSLLARAKMILDWHQRHQYCANCGAKSKSEKGGYVRRCNDCDTEHFPRVDPVVIMIIIYGEKCLMGRSSHFLPGMYSALAGFMEPGETIEEAVRREVWEEAGIKVGDVEYIKSQPWPFPSSLMIGVIGKALHNDINIENDELDDARWFTKEQIAEVIRSGGDDQFRVPDKLAIARHLLDHWVHKV